MKKNKIVVSLISAVLFIIFSCTNPVQENFGGLALYTLREEMKTKPKDYPSALLFLKFVRKALFSVSYTCKYTGKHFFCVNNAIVACSFVSKFLYWVWNCLYIYIQELVGTNNNRRHSNRRRSIRRHRPSTRSCPTFQKL